MTQKKLLLSILLIVATPLVSGTGIAKPEDTVIQLHKSVNMNYDYNQTKAIISNCFDFKKISRIILGSHWTNANDAQRGQFISALEQMTTTNYMKNFQSKNVSVLKIEHEKRRAKVYLAVNFTGGKTITVTYILLNSKSKSWKIVNVIIEGVSDLALKKIEYTTFLKTQSISELADLIKKKNPTNECCAQ